MHFQTATPEDFANFDSETAALLRQALLPILEQAPDWPSLAAGLARKGYALGFRMGHMVIMSAETGAILGTGHGFGAPLASIARRIGRPVLRLGRDGCSASLD
ncbi:hypothetical protein GCM10011415_16620 [Salipiger pallidus]|uniref:Uncharacterized protein n=1 Tax=Salipiger pallidus TaxID=1775170 RepID=A0A8J2ZIW9_9RHOB|nr:hypothetical protein [Salipiger pallidus]GGG69805.1 hypothetical protein GCM10011415_16620 [Salipiger pallidus]